MNLHKSSRMSCLEVFRVKSSHFRVRNPKISFLWRNWELYQASSWPQTFLTELNYMEKLFISFVTLTRRMYDEILPHFDADRKKRKLSTVSVENCKKWNFLFLFSILQIAHQALDSWVWEMWQFRTLELWSSILDDLKFDWKCSNSTVLMNVHAAAKLSLNFLFTIRRPRPVREAARNEVREKWIQSIKKRAPTTTFLCFWLKIKLSSIKKSLRR